MDLNHRPWTKLWWGRMDLNHRPISYEPTALTTELLPLVTRRSARRPGSSQFSKSSWFTKLALIHNLTDESITDLAQSYIMNMQIYDNKNKKL